jgi:hypothetical protein
MPHSRPGRQRTTPQLRRAVRDSLAPDRRMPGKPILTPAEGPSRRDAQNIPHRARTRRRCRCRIIQTATSRRSRPTGPRPSGAPCRSKPRPGTEPLIPAARRDAAPACALRVSASPRGTCRFLGGLSDAGPQYGWIGHGAGVRDPSPSEPFGSRTEKGSWLNCLSSSMRLASRLDPNERPFSMLTHSSGTCQ